MDIIELVQYSVKAAEYLIKLARIKVSESTATRFRSCRDSELSYPLMADII